MKFLLIDDERVVMEWLRDELFDEGHDVDVICTTEEAVRRIEGGLENYDAVILDIMMEVAHLDIVKADGGMLTGRVLFDRIRLQKPSIPVVFLTNRADLDIDALAPKDRRARLLRKTVACYQSIVSAVSEVIAGNISETAVQP